MIIHTSVSLQVKRETERENDECVQAYEGESDLIFTSMYLELQKWTWRLDDSCFAHVCTFLKTIYSLCSYPDLCVCVCDQRCLGCTSVIIDKVFFNQLHWQVTPWQHCSFHFTLITHKPQWLVSFTQNIKGWSNYGFSWTRITSKRQHNRFPLSLVPALGSPKSSPHSINRQRVTFSKWAPHME